MRRKWLEKIKIQLSNRYKFKSKSSINMMFCSNEFPTTHNNKNDKEVMLGLLRLTMPISTSGFSRSIATSDVRNMSPQQTTRKMGRICSRKSKIAKQKSCITKNPWCCSRPGRCWSNKGKNYSNTFYPAINIDAEKQNSPKCSATSGNIVSLQWDILYTVRDDLLVEISGIYCRLMNINLTEANPSTVKCYFTGKCATNSLPPILRLHSTRRN
jgi:hypothetical protein